MSQFYRSPRSSRRPTWPAVVLSIALLAAILAAGCGPTSRPGELAPTATQAPAAPLIPAAPTPTPLPAVDTPVPTPTLPAGPSVPDLFGQPPPVSALAYALPLTVQHVTETSATLFLELSQPAPGAVYYRPAAQAAAASDAVVQAVPLDPARARQQVLLENLQPGVEYRVQVGLSEADGSLRQPAFRGQAWGELRFRAASAQEPLRFGVFGDASFGDPATVALVERMLTYDLSFAIHTGDVVAEIQDDPSPPEAYATKFYHTLSGLLHRMPVYTVIGNHDYDPPARWQERPFYYYAFPPFTDPLFRSAGDSGTRQYYAFTYQGVQFLMLDTQAIFGQPGRAEQDAWMAERLADPRFRFTIPVFHVPPFFSSAVHPDDRIPVRQSWHAPLAAAGVPVVFSGHSHHYERALADGVTYIISGGGSSILYAQGESVPESQVYARRTHFVLVEVYPSRIELSAIDKDGEVLDQSTVEP